MIDVTSETRLVQPEDDKGPLAQFRQRQRLPRGQRAAAGQGDDHIPDLALRSFTLGRHATGAQVDAPLDQRLDLGRARQLVQLPFYLGVSWAKASSPVGIIPILHELMTPVSSRSALPLEHQRRPLQKGVAGDGQLGPVMAAAAQLEPRAPVAARGSAGSAGAATWSAAGRRR